CPNPVRVEQDDGAAAHQAKMAVHGVLVECDQHVQPVAGTQDGLVAGPEGEQDVSAADDRLIGAVGLQVQTPSNKDARQNVARGGNPLACRAANPDIQ